VPNRDDLDALLYRGHDVFIRQLHHQSRGRGRTGLTRTRDPYHVEASVAICTLAGEKLGDKADGCTVCLLGDGCTIIEDVANQMTQHLMMLPDE